MGCGEAGKISEALAVREFSNRSRREVWAPAFPVWAGTLVRSGRTSAMAMAGLDYAPPPGYVPPPTRVSDSVKVRVPRKEAAVVEYPVRRRPPIGPDDFVSSLRA